jgi:hypothetical protein
VYTSSTECDSCSTTDIEELKTTPYDEFRNSFTNPTNNTQSMNCLQCISDV